MSNYWLEITDRNDLGTDLKAPQTDESGNQYWGYSLLKEVVPGDWVFHYHKPQHAIVGYSQAVGTSFDEPIVWAAHGTAHRSKGTEPERRPGWKLPLSGFTLLSTPVTLERVRQMEPAIKQVKAELERAHRQLYFPFAASPNRPLRPTQGYLTRFPRELLPLLGIKEPTSLLHLDGEMPGTLTPSTAFAPGGRNPSRVTPPQERGRIGAPYHPASPRSNSRDLDPFEVDPEVVERGNRGHADTQNKLADFLRMVGLEPLSPAPGDPTFDIGWRRDDTFFVAEVKSVTPANEERQLRLGLGQVLWYRGQLLARGIHARAVLVPERAPTDPRWTIVCDELGVIIAAPGTFQRLLSVAVGS